MDFISGSLSFRLICQQKVHINCYTRVTLCVLSGKIQYGFKRGKKVKKKNRGVFSDRLNVLRRVTETGTSVKGIVDDASDDIFLYCRS